MNDISHFFDIDGLLDVIENPMLFYIRISKSFDDHNKLHHQMSYYRRSIIDYIFGRVDYNEYNYQKLFINICKELRSENQINQIKAIQCILHPVSSGKNIDLSYLIPYVYDDENNYDDKKCILISEFCDLYFMRYNNSYEKVLELLKSGDQVENMISGGQVKNMKSYNTKYYDPYNKLYYKN